MPSITSPDGLTFELLRRATGILPGDRRILDVPSDFPWKPWLASLLPEGLAPLFGYYFLTHSEVERFIPGSVRQSCTDRFYASAARNSRFLEAAGKIVDAFSTSGVRALVLKGAHLTESYYPHFGCRPMGDVDLLVRPEEYPSAARILHGLGYRGTDSTENGAPPQEGPALNASVWRCTDPAGPPIHLHWHLFNSGQPLGIDTRLNQEPLWDAARPFTLAGRNAFGLGSPELILHLFEHALRHGYDRLLLLADMAAVSVRDELAGDSARIEQTARDCGLLPALRIGRLLMARHCGNAIGAEGDSAAALFSFPERRLVGQFPSRRATRLLVYGIYAAQSWRHGSILDFLRLSLWPDRHRLRLHDGGGATRQGYIVQAARHLFRRAESRGD